MKKHNKDKKNPLGSVRLPIPRTGGFMKAKKGKGSYNRKDAKMVICYGR